MTQIDREKLGELLSAYMDGELTSRETRRVEHLLRTDNKAVQFLEELRRSSDLVRSLPRHSAPASISEDVRLQLERSELLWDSPYHNPGSGGSTVSRARWLSVAAVVSLALLGGWWVLHDAERDRQGSPLDRVALAPKEHPDDRPVKAPDVHREAMRSRDVRGRPRRGARQRDSAVSTGQRDSSSGRLSTASFEDKRRERMDVAALRRHRFENETVHVKVATRNVADRDALAARLVERLRRGHVADLSEATITGGAMPMAGSVFFSGEPGVNFHSTSQAQILVQASLKQITELLLELEQSADSVETTSLELTSASFSGLKQVRAVLRSLGGPRTAEEVGPPGSTAVALKSSDARQRDGDGFAPFRSWLSAIGLDQVLDNEPPLPSPDANRRVRADEDGGARRADSTGRDRSSSASRQAHGAVGKPSMQGAAEPNKSKLAERLPLVERRLKQMEESQRGDGPGPTVPTAALGRAKKARSEPSPAHLGTMDGFPLPTIDKGDAPPLPPLGKGVIGGVHAYELRTASGALEPPAQLITLVFELSVAKPQRPAQRSPAKPRRRPKAQEKEPASPR